MATDSGTLIRANLHTHTHASAGKMAPLIDQVANHNRSPEVRALLRKADRITLDCVAITDHAEAVTAAEWQANGQAAAAAPNGLLALRGFEWTLVTGLAQGDHVNVFGTSEQANTRDETGGQACGTRCQTVRRFYSWLQAAQSTYQAPVVAQFNHLALRGSHFDGFAAPATPALRDLVALAELAITQPLASAREVKEKALLGISLPMDARDGELYWRQALGRGWRLSPTLNADNDGPLHTNARRFHTGIYLKPGAARTREAVLEALAARRTFASEDALAELQLWHGEHFMGSADLTVTRRPSFRLVYRHPSAPNLDAHLDLANSVAVVSGAQHDLGAPRREGEDWVWDLTVPVEKGSHYLYVRLQQRREGTLQLRGNCLFSAPIWFTAR